MISRRRAQSLFLLTFLFTQKHLRHGQNQHLCRNGESDFLTRCLRGCHEHPNHPCYNLRAFPREPGSLGAETEGLLVLDFSLLVGKTCDFCQTQSPFICLDQKQIFSGLKGQLFYQYSGPLHPISPKSLIVSLLNATIQLLIKPKLTLPVFLVAVCCVPLFPCLPSATIT